MTTTSPSRYLKKYYMYIKREIKRKVCGHEFRLSNYRKTETGFDADLMIDGEYCGPCTEQGHERNRTTVQTERELKQSKARLGYHGSSKRADLRLITLVLSYEMDDAGITMTIPEQRERRAQDALERELRQKRRTCTMLEVKNEELRTRMRSRIFRY